MTLHRFSSSDRHAEPGPSVRAALPTPSAPLGKREAHFSPSPPQGEREAKLSPSRPLRGERVGVRGWCEGGKGRAKRTQAGFTLIEIALALAVIVFAAGVIVTVLPLGLTTQRDNRAETIVAEDAVFWLEAIRTGARGLDELTNYVDEIEVGGNTYTFGNGFWAGADIIGLLSTPGGAQATVRSITGALADKSTVARDLAFKYRLEVDNEESKNAVDAVVSELRLTLRWPVRPSGLGNRRYVVRAQVNGVPEEDPPNSQRFYFVP